MVAAWTSVVAVGMWRGGRDGVMQVDPKGFADGRDVGCERRSDDDSWIMGRGCR